MTHSPEQLRSEIQTFVAKHNRFPTGLDIPNLPSLRTLQRLGIHIGHFIETKKSSKEQIAKMQDSTQKILDSVSELAFLLHKKGYEVKTNQRIALDNNQKTNIICIDKKTLKKYALELICPSSKLSVPASLRRRMFKFSFESITEYETIFIVNINESINIGYYRPRQPLNEKVTIVNLSELPL